MTDILDESSRDGVVQESLVDTYHIDYPRERIGGGNPYYRCSSCGVSDPQINGKLEGHKESCSWAKQQRHLIANSKKIMSNDNHDYKKARIEHDPDRPSYFVPCLKCERAKYAEENNDPRCRHSKDCEHATIDDLRHYLRRAYGRLEWLEKKSSNLLESCRAMHGKIALMKNEIKKLRKRDSNTEK